MGFFCAMSNTFICGVTLSILDKCARAEPKLETRPEYEVITWIWVLSWLYVLA
jgi:hypothetical protein